MHGVTLEEGKTRALFGLIPTAVVELEGKQVEALLNAGKFSCDNSVFESSPATSSQEVHQGLNSR